jgi:hypothetical protein
MNALRTPCAHVEHLPRLATRWLSVRHILYAIRDGRSDALLFKGAIFDPTQE